MNRSDVKAVLVRLSQLRVQDNKASWGWLVMALTCVPVVVDLLCAGRSRPFAYLASDSFYYLTIARHWAQEGLSSFDGQQLTNGYHPLWQWLTTGLYRLNELLGLHESALLYSLTLICVALVGWGLKRLVDASLYHASSAGVLAGSLLLPVGLFSLLCAPLWWSLGLSGVQAQSGIEGGRPLFGTAWIYMNGMESGLVIVSFAALLWRAARGQLTVSYSACLKTGALLAALTLSRLDHGLIAAWIYLGCLGQALLRERQTDSAPLSRGRALLSLSAPFALPIALYLLYNHEVFGSALPLSGKLKSSFPRLTNSNIDHLRALLSAHPPAHWLPRAGRWLQMAIPALFALAWLPSWLSFTQRDGRVSLGARPQRTELDALLGWSALGVLSLFVYNLLFVGLFHQGTWYYPVSTLFVSLVSLRWIEWLSPLIQRAPSWLSRRLSPKLWASLSALLTLFIFMQLHRVEVRAKWSELYYEEAPKLREHYGDETPKLLSYDDGIVAFATALPTLSGLGFALDREGAAAYQSKTLLELAVQRGHVYLTSLAYFNQDLMKRLPPDGQLRSAYHKRVFEKLLRSWPLSVSPKELKRFEFTIDYLSPNKRLLVIKVQARAQR